MKHNLFDKPTDIIMECDRSGFNIKKTSNSNNIFDALSFLDFYIEEIDKRYLYNFNKKDYDFLNMILNSNNYLFS